MLPLETTRQIITEKFPSLEIMQRPIYDALYWKVCFALHATLHLFVLWQMFLLQTSFLVLREVSVLLRTMPPPGKRWVEMRNGAFFKSFRTNNASNASSTFYPGFLDYFYIFAASSEQKALGRLSFQWIQSRWVGEFSSLVVFLDLG